MTNTLTLSLKPRGMYGSVVVPRSIFENLNQDYFISHSNDRVKYMCANQREAEHLESLGIATSSVVCDWYEIVLDDATEPKERGE